MLLLMLGIGIGVMLGVGGLVAWAMVSPSDPDKAPKRTRSGGRCLIGVVRRRCAGSGSGWQQ